MAGVLSTEAFFFFSFFSFHLEDSSNRGLTPFAFDCSLPTLQVDKWMMMPDVDDFKFLIVSK